MMSTRLFERAQQLALNLAGIELVDRHRELLENRCRRHGILTSDAFGSLLTQAENGDRQAGQTLLSLMTTKFTSFFRHPLHFDRAAQHALQACEQRGRATIWSAGAATGEEPWSLAIRLLEVFQHDDPPVKIVATDIDSAAIEFGRRGEYAESSMKSVESTRRNRFFAEANHERRCVITEAPRQLVEFQILNLADESWAIEGPLDVIFCRNVLMYLNTGHRRHVVERLAALLAPGGLLILDPAEHMADSDRYFHSSGDGIYSLRAIRGNGQCPTSTAHS